MSVIKCCYRGVLLMRVQSCYYLKRFCGATKRMSEMGLRLEYHSDGIIPYACECIIRCVLFSLPMQINAWETYSDFVRNDHYTRTSRYCETITCNCVFLNVQRHYSRGGTDIVFEKLIIVNYIILVICPPRRF